MIQIGSFLENFDLYLYIHLAFILNGVFFPKTDPFVTALIAAFTFSSTYILRPAGALFFGYLGDHYGRKSTIVLTTLIMALCSFTIASLPSYEEIGITASIIMILCRMLQGFSAIGEFVGALVYVTETTPAPRSYFYTALVIFFTNLGSTFALLMGVLFLMTNSEEGWRMAFYFGAGIAVIGSVARTQLRETPDFLQEKRQNPKKKTNLLMLLPTKKTRKSFWCYVGVDCLRPLYFYLAFIYMGGILTSDYGYSYSQLLTQNLFVACIEALASLAYGWLALKVFPLEILKVRGLIFLCFALCLPSIMYHATSPMTIFAIQCGLMILGRGITPAYVLFLQAFPPIGRYTQAATAHALSRVFTTLITSFGCVIMAEYLGFEGIMLILIFAIFVYLISVYRFSFQSERSQDQNLVFVNANKEIKKKYRQ